MMPPADAVAIIGGGYAGMAAAVELSRAGIRVEVFEAANVLGGRARRVEAQGIALDNGLHILIGAYREMLRLIAVVTRPEDSPALRRVPLELDMGDRFHLKAAPVAYPLNLAIALLRAKGICLREKWSLAKMLQRLKTRQFKLSEDVSVERFLRQHDQSENIKQVLWYPLCTAALNTLPEEASAQVFANVLRDTFSAPANSSDLLLPTTDLSTLFPQRAARFVVDHGGQIHFHARVNAVRRAQGAIELTFREEVKHFSRVVLAVAPQHLSALLDGLPGAEAVQATLARFEYRPIFSVYLGYPPPTQLPKAMMGLHGHFAQWAFDRGQLCQQPGVIGVVISASGAHQDIAHDTLAQHVHTELRALLPQIPPPTWHQVIAEKRATFACTPRLQRPATRVAVPGLFLAGDYLEAQYPATLEAAVRSGVHAAHLVMESR